MSAPCPFDAQQLSFAGSPVGQARCLVRFVKRAGEVDDTPANLPQPLIDLLSDPLNLGITKTRLRSYLQKQGIPESSREALSRISTVLQNPGVSAPSGSRSATISV
ncbi:MULTISPECIES: hypothetical protein [unclassified Bradyrhizobium]|uniref:hypothetical protein n=1 Tax=unclassified Bradyrhizobium TaxID=2631580 RepID=UPI0029168DD8|nr:MULTISPECIES: hypothetical protein [unclassified Bradyrhizobium]